MNLKALITSAILLGSSSLAFARPAMQASAQVRVSVNVVPKAPVMGHPGYAPDITADWQRYRSSFPIRDTSPYYAGSFDLIVGADTSTYTGPFFAIEAARRAWSPVTEPTRIERGREFIHLSKAGPVYQVMLQRVAGTTSITQVAVQFTDNSTQVIKFGGTLDARNTTLDLGLHGNKAISRIVVYGTSGDGSAYRILGR
jgi:hypothetical protein